MTAQLVVEDFSLVFRTRHGTVRALEDVSLSIERGEILGVVGESGSGKSVLAYAIIMKGTPIYELVSAAYQVTLVGAFVPLVFGIYWKRATTQGAIFSLVLGIGVGFGSVAFERRRAG